MGTNSVTGSLRTSHPGQQGKVASIRGVGTTIGTLVGRSGMACSGTLSSAYASKYKVWSEDSLVYSSSDSARSIWKGRHQRFLSPEISEPTTWEVTSARVQKHSLSTMLSRQADNDSFSNSNALALSSDRSICSFKASILAHCVIVTVAYATIARLFSLYFAKSNSTPTLVDLISPFILSIHVTLILSYPYIFTFILIQSLSLFERRWLFS